MRTVLLWAARDPRLKAWIPRRRFAQRAVRRFMPGETLNEALAAADRLAAAGNGIVFTRLGENVATAAEADAVAEHYHEVLRAAALRPRPPEISVKLTQLGLDQDPEATYGRALALARHAADAGTWLWLDIEGSAYAQATVDLYARLHAEAPRTGLCLQAYLHRTPADIARLLPGRPAIRLVKGAYDEPASIAWRDRAAVDSAYLGSALLLVQAAARDGARVALGTHDAELIRRLGLLMDAQGIARSAAEVHMLYGIRADALAALAREGWPTATLIAYGASWYPWYVRRLAERPANVLFALRQLLP